MTSRPMASGTPRLDQPVQWALTFRAILALLFGLSEGAMLLFAFWLPRISAALMATFFTGFTTIDGLVALFAAAWGLTRGGRWRLLACKGVVGVAAGVLTVVTAPGHRGAALAILAWWAIITGVLQGVEALALRGGWQGRPLLVGMVHGLAGSAAVALLVLAVVPSPAWALGYLGLFGAGTILGMALVTMLIAFPASLAVARMATARRWLTAASGVVSVVFGVLLAFSLGGPDGLFSSAPAWDPR